MLKEEKELYAWAEDMFDLNKPGIRANRVIRADLRQLTRALVRAVRNDEMAKQIEKRCMEEYMGVVCESCKAEAAAIRGRK